MSLDVYLYVTEKVQKTYTLKRAIFEPDGAAGRLGETLEVLGYEWASHESLCKIPLPSFYVEYEEECVYSANITGNLATMAKQVGIYDDLWQPQTLEIHAARWLISPLQNGLEELCWAPEHFRQFNSKNGWGKYEDLVSFAENYLNACKKYPDASVRVSA